MKRAGKAVILLGIVLLALSPVASGDQFVTSMKIYLQLNPPSSETWQSYSHSRVFTSGAVPLNMEVFVAVGFHNTETENLDLAHYLDDILITVT